MASPSQNDTIGVGLAPPQASLGEYNQLMFAIQQALSKVNTIKLVQIVSCTNSGGLSPVGMVNVFPLVNQIDLQGNPTPHETVFNVPYLRIQGGANAIILDPQPGDIGICGFADRDISKIKTNKKQDNPGSFRQFSFSDGLYLGGTLNGTPSQYVQFSGSGIAITSPSKVTLTAPVVEIDAATSCTINTPVFTVNGTTVLNGPITQTNTAGGSTTATIIGPLNVTNDVTAEGTSLHTHVHSDPQGGNTGPPV